MGHEQPVHEASVPCKRVPLIAFTLRADARTPLVRAALLNLLRPIELVMQPTLFNVVRDHVASVFCCGTAQASTDQSGGPMALAIRGVANTGRTRRIVQTTAVSENTITLNDDDKKNIVHQFHRSLTRSRFPEGTSRHARDTGKTLAALSLVDKSWRLACKDELAVAYVSRKVADDFDDNFDEPIASIQYIDRTIHHASLRGQAALEIVDAALRRSVSEDDLYDDFARPAQQRQSFPYAEILNNVLDLRNVDARTMNIIIAKACNIAWGGPNVFGLGRTDHAKLGYSTALLDKMLHHAECDLADASKRENPIALRSRNNISRDQVMARWPTLSEMTKVIAGIHSQEGPSAAHTALGKLLDCIQRAPLAHRTPTTLGVVAYANAFLDRRAYDPFANGVATHDGEKTVDFIFTSIKQRLNKAEFGAFLDQLSADTGIRTDVKARAYSVYR